MCRSTSGVRPARLRPVRLTLLALVALVACSAAVAAGGATGPGGRLHKRSAGAARYCGRNLANKLDSVCKGRFNEPFPKDKRSVSDESEYPAQPLPSRVLHEALGTLFESLPIEEQLRVVAVRTEPHPRRTRGVHEECCKNPCTDEVLETYCAP